MKNLLGTVLALSVLGCSTFPASAEKFDLEAFYNGASVHTVSLTQLLTTPEKFLNKRVSVNGYYAATLGDWLYLSDQHKTIADYASAINILDDSDEGELANSDCNQSWVKIDGYFLATFKQDSRTLEGRLVVDSVYSHKTGKDCWERKSIFKYL